LLAVFGQASETAGLITPRYLESPTNSAENGVHVGVAETVLAIGRAMIQAANRGTDGSSRLTGSSALKYRSYKSTSMNC
jgi:hypothetical protein